MTQIKVQETNPDLAQDHQGDKDQVTNKEGEVEANLCQIDKEEETHVVEVLKED